MTKKLICSLVAACALSATATAAFLLTPGQALAQNDGTTVDQGDSTQDADDAGSTDYKRDHEERIKEALQGLVDDGTLTTAQVDAVVEALAEARPDGRHGAGIADIANILGVTEDELKTALANGETIADVATEQGVAVQEVIDAIVAATTERVDAAVEAGRSQTRNRPTGFSTMLRSALQTSSTATWSVQQANTDEADTDEADTDEADTEHAAEVRS